MSGKFDSAEWGQCLTCGYWHKAGEVCACSKGADMVNRPPHYNAGDIECIDAIRAALGEDGFRAFCRGTAIKYAWRAGLKGDAIEDMAKCAWYSRMAAGDDPRRLPVPVVTEIHPRHPGR